MEGVNVIPCNKMCDVSESKSETFKTLLLLGTIPYIQPATRKEYFEIAERDNNKIL